MSNAKFTVNGVFKDTVNTVKLLTERKRFIANASSQLPPATDALGVNITASLLHPKEQKLVISAVEEHGTAKSYYFESKEKNLAYFRAGQYLTFRLTIGNAVVTRPYSIASAPSAALKGQYQITVKRVKHGFASDYILDNWKVGDEITAYAPEGNFVYEPLRDAPHVVGIAGGSGITPFLSLARAIDDGTEDCSLTLLYGSRNAEEILFREELDALTSRNEKINVVYVLSESNEKGCENGFVGAEMIKKYAPDEKYSIFACGPSAMYEYLKKEITALGLEKKYVRFEQLAVKYPYDDMQTKLVVITVINKGVTAEICGNNTSTVLSALESAGIEVPARCHSGECGFCRSKLISGQVFIPENTDKRRIADAAFGYIHPCCCYPVNDITIKIN